MSNQQDRLSHRKLLDRVVRNDLKLELWKLGSDDPDFLVTTFEKGRASSRNLFATREEAVAQYNEIGHELGFFSDFT